jgi:hypothetical protein
MRRAVLVALAALAVAALAGSARSAPLTACSMVSAAEYKRVLGHAVKMIPGEGTHSCNVFIGAAPVSAKTLIIPNLTPYSAAYGTYIKGMYARAAKSRGGSFEKVPALGPLGAVLAFHGPDPSVTSYFQKGNWFVAFEGETGTTKSQVLALASLVYHRL